MLLQTEIRHHYECRSRHLGFIAAMTLARTSSYVNRTMIKEQEQLIMMLGRKEAGKRGEKVRDESNNTSLNWITTINNRTWLLQLQKNILIQMIQMK